MNELQQIINNEKNQLALSDEYLDSLRLELNNAVVLVTSADTSQSRFCIDKSTLAAETASFYLKQRQRIFNSGFPSSQLPYLTLVTQKLTQLNNVFIELYKINSGYIYFLKDTYPDVAIWTLLSIGVERIDKRACLFAITMSDTLGEKSWKRIASLSDSEELAIASRTLIQSSSVYASLLFETLQSLGALSSKFAMTLLNSDCTINKEIVHRYLVTQNLPSSCAWLIEQPVTPVNIFEHLLSRVDRSTWFRMTYDPKQVEITDEMMIFGSILDIPEYVDIPIDFGFSLAPIMFALKGDSSAVNDIITMLSTIDEDTAEPWIVALYIVFGEQLPVLPSQIGSDIDYSLAITQIQTWWENKGNVLFSSWRYGEPQSFDNSLELLASVEVTADFRLWIWKELCITCRGYFPWNSLVNAEHQYTVLSKMKGNSIARERYNLRAQHAIMGY
ncbi:hypothetical protein [Moritella viscosa]|uniref:Uncharacterized protein n=1 Tax=Moritella viscosa TaxID=80854 RepID=A0A1L0C5N2_9GAMM|nr:hypothetical protein [Moritella viscosa]SGZ15892.1 Putative uncharacterized protein [Moritella viscosa]SHO10948.1 Putative uncharacterized protein [Moritella viscosa]SHO10964.1 Putative uncharacterized protein [Moritella viscosa]SHO17426.1 Putative uncharacterized protein [Moritella viscosa]SHO17709.1 Putative uncharacterized protein [Moritella viscosa]